MEGFISHFSKLIFEFSCQVVLSVFKRRGNRFEAQVKADSSCSVMRPFALARGLCVYWIFLFITVKLVLGGPSVVSVYFRGIDMD